MKTDHSLPILDLLDLEVLVPLGGDPHSPLRSTQELSLLLLALRYHRLLQTDIYSFDFLENILESDPDDERKFKEEHSVSSEAVAVTLNFLPVSSHQLISD